MYLFITKSYVALDFWYFQVLKGRRFVSVEAGYKYDFKRETQIALRNDEDLKKIEKTRNSIHSEVAASYTSFHKNGEKYFQIDTYGPKERMHKGTTSQSLKINRDIAVKLVERRYWWERLRLTRRILFS